MTRERFADYIRKRNGSEDEIARSVALGERYQRFCLENHSLPAREIVRAFVDMLMDERADTYDHLLALSRYGRYSGNTELSLEMLSLLDGREVLENLHQRLIRMAPKEICDVVFADIKMPSLGVSSQHKAQIMKVVLERLRAIVGDVNLDQFLSTSLCDLPDHWYEHSKMKFAQLRDLRAYLANDAREFIAELERINEAGGLFFNQVITAEVIDLVRSQPEIASGVLEGDTLYITKIPYMAKEYLATDDPLLKRYFCCHCAWARESILTGETVPANICHCSAGFAKRPWEVIFGQPLKADVLESALKGDLRCRFAIHLPAQVK